MTRNSCPRLVPQILAPAAGLIALVGAITPSQAAEPIAATSDLDLIDADVRHDRELGLLVFSQTVDGTAGATRPAVPPHAGDGKDVPWRAVAEAGNLVGSQVLAHVFVTDLPPAAVGFKPVDGLLALSATNHPAFDDTPLWDENQDASPDNDGGTWHAHWVVLVEDDRAAGGYAVREIEGDPAGVLPPTAPGMGVYLDSPGFQVRETDDQLQIVVPMERVDTTGSFAYDALTAYLEVGEGDAGEPALGVYQVYDVLSGDLSLPYEVRIETMDVEAAE